MTGILTGFLTIRQKNKATVSGGSMISDDNYFYNIFTSNGTLNISDSSLVADVLMVAGGGGGATSQFSANPASGSGAGGVSFNSSAILTPRSYSIVIGAGGAGQANGNSTTFTTLNSVSGGGFGISTSSGTIGASGGSGGGAVGQAGGGASSWAGGSPVSGQGFSGGSVLAKVNSAAGGGGSGQKAPDVSGVDEGGSGGWGTNQYSSILTACYPFLGTGWSKNHFFTGNANSSTIVLKSNTTNGLWEGPWIGSSISGTGIQPGTYITGVDILTGRKTIGVTVNETLAVGRTTFDVVNSSTINIGDFITFKLGQLGGTYQQENYMVSAINGNTITFTPPIVSQVTSDTNADFYPITFTLSQNTVSSVNNNLLIKNDTYIAGGGGGKGPSKFPANSGAGGASVFGYPGQAYTTKPLVNSGSGTFSGPFSFSPGGASGIVIVRSAKTKINTPNSFISAIDYVPTTTNLINVTTLTSGTIDDGFYTLNLPFTTYFNGVGYNQIHIGTNSYATFGGGSTQYTSLSASNPAFPKIMVGAADNGSTGIYYTSSASSWTMRYEGSTNRSGTPVDLIWELFCSSNNPKNIRLSVKTMNRPSGLFGVYSSNALLLSFSTSEQTFSYNIGSI